MIHIILISAPSYPLKFPILVILFVNASNKQANFLSFCTRLENIIKPKLLKTHQFVQIEKGKSKS